MLLTINAHVHAKKVQRYDTDTMQYIDETEWEVYPFNMAENFSDRVLLGVQQITINVPENFDMREGLVKNLEAQKKQLMAEFQARVTAIDNQIQKYLAIEA